MSRKSLLSLCIVLIASPLFSCGAKRERCEDKTPNSFRTFLDEEWSVYCEQYTSHVQSPVDYSIEDLTEFFAGHSEKVKALKEKSTRYEKYETCFEGPKEELRLRELQACVQDNDETDLQMTNAWTAVFEPWIEEVNFQVDAVDPPLAKLETEAKRLIKKAGEAFDFKAKLPKEQMVAFDEFSAGVDQVDKDLQLLEKRDELFKKLEKLADGNDALQTTMVEDIQPQITAFEEETASLRKRWETMDMARDYLTLAVNSAGVKCPKGERRARTELRLANKLLSGKNKEVNGSGIRIASKTKTETRGDVKVERFDGFICGTRAKKNQFEGMPRLCAQHRFVIERQTKPDSKKWDDWALKSFEESGPSGGVDCSLKK